MPRKARIVSKSGIYHILLKSFGDELIFKDSEDIEKFLEIIKEYKPICGYKIYAYCILGGHLHLLIHALEKSPGDIFKRIGGKYVYWYNQKYLRHGPLFQDRYKSEPIENDKAFLTAIRFIHQNPIRHEICERVEEYSLSSYGDYINSLTELVDIDYLISKIDIRQFIDFNAAENSDECIDIESLHRMNDQQVIKIIYKISKCKTADEFLALPTMKREIYIKKIKDEGVSFRQLSKHTGVGIGVVRRCCDNASLIPITLDRIMKRNKSTSVSWITNGVK